MWFVCVRAFRFLLMSDECAAVSSAVLITTHFSQEQFSDNRIREHAVKYLDSISDEELTAFLLQVSLSLVVVVLGVLS